nr:hypothetical protein [Tanacetum cinerariifolium]
NTKAYKEYYACATEEAAPKPKASARRKRGGSDSTTTPPTAVASLRPITTIAAAPRLTATAKGKQPAKATSPYDPSEVERTEAEQLKIVLRRSRQETYISQHGGSSIDEGTETREEEEESFDPIPRTPEDGRDDGNGEEDQGLKTNQFAEVVSNIPEDVRMMMIRKDPPLDQTGGLRDEEKVGSLNQLALHLNQQPEVQAGLQQGVNLDRCQPKPPTLDCDWNTTLPAAQGRTRLWISDLAKQVDSRSSFNELLDTLIEFSNFIMNWLGVDTLTHELLAGPTYELMRGSCNSLTELEYHLEEVCKATTDQLDWINPEGEKYPHNLQQPLPLIPDNRGRRTKAADYGHIKWIEDLVPRTMWIQEPINYDKHALWGVSHWGQKRQQFYGFAVNRESALDVYSKRRIIAVTDLKIVEWHSYKHLDWISDVYKEYRHPAACGRSSTGSRKLPE